MYSNKTTIFRHYQQSKFFNLQIKLVDIFPKNYIV